MRTEYETIIMAYTPAVKAGYYTTTYTIGRNSRKMHARGLTDALQHMQDHADITSVSVTTQATSASLCANYNPYAMCRTSARNNNDTHWTHTDF